MMWLTPWVACATEATLPTQTIQVGGQTLTVEVADDDAERARGLMFRKSLAEGDGMLFVFQDERVRGFWMKDTQIPLSIAYVDGQGVIVRISDLTPFDTARVTSLYPARYAIEVPQGWFAAKGIEKGDKVTGLQ